MFLYFRSGDSRPVNRDVVSKLGLDYAFTGQVESRQVISSTPTGKNGCVFGDSERLGRTVKMDLDSQVWRKLRDDLYVGYFKDSPPTPETLARPQMLPGYMMQLGEYQWQIPLVRNFDGEYASALPAYMDLDEAGRPVRGEVVEKYRRLWELTTPFCYARLESATGEDAPEPDEGQFWQAVEALFQANYVVSLVELAHMRALLMDDEATAQIPYVSNDFPNLLKWLAAEKKTSDPPTPPGSTTEDGEPG